RPKTLSEVTAQDNTIQILSRTLQSSNLPHMLFYGPPGTGKTSTILALAKQLYGPELMKSRVLELNASDERGISIVRQKVKDFARQQLSSAPTYNVMTEDKDGGEGKMVRYRDKYPCPPFKIIVLDEADSMTQDAQSALRRTMETYSKMTRFCLVCNYVTRIIDPLASRCSKFRFKSLDQGNAVKRVEDIARLEGVELDQGVSEELVRVADGDLRKAITFLQSAARLVSVKEPTRKGKPVIDDDEMDVDDDKTLVNEKVSLQSIAEIAGVIPGPTLNTFSDSLFPKSSSRSIRYNEIAKVVENMVAEGWSASQTVAQLYEQVMFDERVEDIKKNKSLSDAFDPVLALQGIGWLTRKALGAATVNLHIKHYTAEDGATKIDIDQIISGGLKGSAEERTLDWQYREHTDYLFGSVRGRNRYTTLAALLEEAKGKGVTEEDAKFLAEGWLKENEEGEVLESWVENEGSKWTAWQVWGFAEIGGERKQTRRVVVRKTDKDEVKRVRLVYDYTGELA
ncbi:nuclear protein localization protein 4, partial [Curvularia kusanoi]